MNNQKSELYFLLSLLAGISILIFFIFKPFLYALILAMVFAIIFHPIHEKILAATRGKKWLAALFASAFVLFIIIVPVVFLSMQIFKEAAQLYSLLAQNGGAANLSHNLENFLQNIKKFFPLPIDISVYFNQYLKQGLSWLLQFLGPLFANIVRILMSSFVFLFALYYFFKDGQKLKKAISTLSPLQDTYNETIFNKLSLAINSIIKGNLVVALIQGVLTAIGFIIFGVPNATLWGSVAAVAALIPGIGTSLILIPAILFLFLSGKTFFAVGLLLWGMTAVGLIDNFLGPKLVSRGIELHSFLVLLSVLGGISFFGPLGFLLGPLILCLFFVIFEVYSSISERES